MLTFRNFTFFDTADAGSILQIEPKRFDSGYKPEPTKVVDMDKLVCPCKMLQYTENTDKHLKFVHATTQVSKKVCRRPNLFKRLNYKETKEKK